MIEEVIFRVPQFTIAASTVFNPGLCASACQIMKPPNGSFALAVVAESVSYVFSRSLEAQLTACHSCGSIIESREKAHLHRWQ